MYYNYRIPKIERGGKNLLGEYCIEENFVWGNHYTKAFHARIDSDTYYTIFKYQIPFSPDEEKLFMARFELAPGERMNFYRNLVCCIQQEIKASQLLSSNKVPSILKILQVEQTKSSNGIINIYLKTEQVWPLCLHYLHEEVSRIDAINVVARLAITLRDINKAPHNVVMRGLDINEIYINADQKILMGGFYYASSPMLPHYPAYLPGCPKNIPENVLRGEPGDAGTDTYSLACLAWNLFSGIPLDAQIPKHLSVFPQYGTDELAEALWMGRSGITDNSAAFRKRISDCRKQISKSDQASELIPVREQRRKQYAIEIV